MELASCRTLDQGLSRSWRVRGLASRRPNGHAGLVTRKAMLAPVAMAVVAGMLALAGVAQAFSFTRNDYPLPTDPPGGAGFAPQPVTPAVVDLNPAAGKGPDIVMGDGQKGKVWVLLNNGNGTFGDPTLYPGCGAGEANVSDLVAGRFNGDSNVDAIVECAAKVALLPGDGTGKLGAPTSYPTIGGSYFMRFAHFSTPTARELVFGVRNGTTGYTICYFSIAGLIANDANAGGCPSSFSALHFAFDLEVTNLSYGAPDATGDELLAFDTDSNRSLLVMGHGSTGFSFSSDVYTGDKNGTSLASGDMNGDGSTDVVTGNYDGKITVIPWSKDKGFVGVTRKIINSIPAIERIAVADFDGDGRPDIAALSGTSSDPGAGQLAIHRNLGGGNFGPAQSFASFFNGNGDDRLALVPADVNGDGRIDLVASGRNQGKLAVFINHTPKVVTDKTPPVISALSLKPSAFKPPPSGATTAKKPKRRTHVTYKLSEPASVRFTVTQKLAGRRSSSGKCVKATPVAHGAKCTRYVARGSFSLPGHTGKNKFIFTGRLNGAALEPGKYRLTAVARDKAGNLSKPASHSFRIVK